MTSTTVAGGQPKARDPRHVVTEKARLNFASLFSPRAGPNGEEATFQCVLAFDPGTNMVPMHNAARAAAREKWSDKMPANLRSPFRDNSERADQEGFKPGGVFVTCKTKNKPGVVDQSMRPVLSNDVIYSGCWVRASLRAYAYDNKGNKGVSFALINLQKLGDGDRLDNRRNPDQDFEPVEGGGDDDIFGGGGSAPPPASNGKPAAGKGPLDDDIPF